FFSLPVLLLGTMFGAFVAERWLGKKTDTEAFKAGAGAAVGFLLSSVAKLACAVVMVGLYTFAVISVARSAAIVT
ncbi:MAG TPA: DUF456 domain-containing protein, partial [Lacunisphaera sp.]|nr:DUF456 domain-containing protein [Lacunisphaera sp.]